MTTKREKRVREITEEIMQREIDTLRAEVERLKNELRKVGDICAPFMPTTEEDK